MKRRPATLQEHCLDVLEHLWWALACTGEPRARIKRIEALQERLETYLPQEERKE